MESECFHVHALWYAATYPRGLSDELGRDRGSHRSIAIRSRDRSWREVGDRAVLDGMGCASSELGVQDSSFNGPSVPSLVIDAAHRRLFVFGYAGRGFYVRCNLDGTACTNTATTPISSGTNVSALLHGGTLFSVSPSFPSPGIDLVSLSAY